MIRLTDVQICTHTHTEAAAAADLVKSSWVSGRVSSVRALVRRLTDLLKLVVSHSLKQPLHVELPTPQLHPLRGHYLS